MYTDSLPRNTMLGRHERMRHSACYSTNVQHAALLVLVCALCLLLSCAVLVPLPVQAATWPVGQGGLSPSLGFHETYTAGASNQKSYVHSGVDVSASAGTQIVSPIAGTVRFTGSVPSGDSSVNGGGKGQTMRGVSIELEDGRTLTLMPFADIDVSRGDVVSEGDSLGTLAERGDRSSSDPHLHMGLKRGSTYFDPMSLFTLSSATTTAVTPDTDPEEEHAAAPEAPALTGANGEVFAAAEPVTDAAAQGTVAQGAVAEPNAARESLRAREASGAQPAWSPSVAPGETASSRLSHVLSEKSEAAKAHDAKEVDAQPASEERFGTITSGTVSWHPEAADTATPLGDIAACAKRLWGSCFGQAMALASALVGEHALLSPSGCAAGAAFGALLAVVMLVNSGIAHKVRNGGLSSAHASVGGKLSGMAKHAKIFLARSGAG